MSVCLYRKPKGRFDSETGVKSFYTVILFPLCDSVREECGTDTGGKDEHPIANLRSAESSGLVLVAAFRVKWGSLT